MKGVMTPGVSAGSNQVGARVTWMAKLIWPSGAAPAGTQASTIMSVAATQVSSGVDLDTLILIDTLLPASSQVPARPSEAVYTLPDVSSGGSGRELRGKWRDYAQIGCHVNRMAEPAVHTRPAAMRSYVSRVSETRHLGQSRHRRTSGRRPAPVSRSGSWMCVGAKCSRFGQPVRHRAGQREDSRLGSSLPTSLRAAAGAALCPTARGDG